MKKIDNYLEIVKKLNCDNEFSIITSLQNTVSSLNEKNELFFLPIRTFEKYMFTGICNGNNDETIYYLENIQDYSEYIFLDVEKKYPWRQSKKSNIQYVGNIELLVKNIIDYKKLIYIWPNSMTVEACLNEIAIEGFALSSQRIAVIGIGNIGFKLALRLVESGCKISISSKDYNLTLDAANFINRIKPKSTISSPIPFREMATCVHSQDFIFLCTGSGIEIDVFSALNINDNTKIFTLSNINLSLEVENILKDKNVVIKNIDITPFYFLEVLKRKTLLNANKPQRKKYGDLNLVSGGYRGICGDIVVDDALDPKIILGRIDKNGIFSRKMELWFKK